MYWQCHRRFIQKQGHQLMERTLQDVKQVNGEIGKIYYHKCPDNNKYFRSIRLHWNPWVNAITPQISNPLYGEPPEGLEEISTLRLQTLMKHQMGSMFCWSYGTTKRDQNWGTYVWPETDIEFGTEPIANEKEAYTWTKPIGVQNQPNKYWWLIEVQNE